MVGDKGYDAKANREAVRERGICPAIPYRSTTKDRPKFFPKRLYKGRACIEQTFGKIKRFRSTTDSGRGSTAQGLHLRSPPPKRRAKQVHSLKCCTRSFGASTNCIEHVSNTPSFCSNSLSRLSFPAIKTAVLAASINARVS